MRYAVYRRKGAKRTKGSGSLPIEVSYMLSIFVLFFCSLLWTGIRSSVFTNEAAFKATKHKRKEVQVALLFRARRVASRFSLSLCWRGNQNDSSLRSILGEKLD